MDSFGGVPPPSHGTMAAQHTSSTAHTLVCGPLSLSNHTGAQGQYPTTMSFSMQDLMLTGDYDPPGYPTPKIAIKNQHLKRYTNHLASFHLIFKIQINTKFPNPMVPTGSGVVPPWITITPQFGHLIGPIDSFSTPASPLHESHPCMGWCILDSLPCAHASGRDDPLDVECYDGYCPSKAINRMLHDLMNHQPSTAAPAPRPSTPPPCPQQQSLICQHSPQSQIQLRSYICCPLASAYDVEMTHIKLPPQSRLTWSCPLHPALQRSLTPFFVTDVALPSFPPLNRGINFLEASAIVEWQKAVDTDAWSPNTVTVHVHGRTIHTIAACIVDILIHIENQDNPLDNTFLIEDHKLQHNNVIACETTIITLSTGIGPEHAAMREGCTILAQQHNFWQQVPASEMFCPVFSPIVPDRHTTTFCAHGTFLVLHCFLLQQGPMPISI
ncbi:hypothetical protein B0H14DRAFT_2561359 [Mycena olivaceomarginata]|nr:hypothetical protein B0H14DRAFT_2561359 [Mycena olivaceomarginata]